jgi:DNA-binding NarL/FixJ family response regulator
MRRQLFYDPNTLNQLTPRETIVLSAAKNNQAIDDIAESLHIPQPIVIRHLSNIINKLRESDKNLAQQLLYSYNLNMHQRSRAL